MQAIVTKGATKRVCVFNPPQVTHLLTPSKVAMAEMHVQASFPAVDDDEVCFQHPVLRAQYIMETTTLAQEARQIVNRQERSTVDGPHEGS